MSVEKVDQMTGTLGRIMTADGNGLHGIALGEEHAATVGATILKARKYPAAAHKNGIKTPRHRLTKNNTYTMDSNIQVSFST
ncbi:hypothetical protein JHS3_04740 [Jeongeupia sp. HS-3]|nr:hypothetical protein JHS3_04740 [Jeongeupia sp. HS-3]